MDITSIGGSALIAAGKAANIHANNIVNTHTPSYKARAPVYSPIVSGGVAAFSQETNQPVSALRDAIGLQTATIQYKAAANIISRGEEVSNYLIRELA
jgi:flagellar hook protein FlgE